jgi:hypothetical protein
MSTTFHFSSAKEVTNELIETIKFAYKDKSISITIEEEDYIPMWQKEEVLRRKEFAKNNPESLIDFDTMMKELERELGNES